MLTGATSDFRFDLHDRLLVIILTLVGAQGLVILSFSALGILDWCWMPAMLLYLASFILAAKCWFSAPPSQQAPVREAWKSPWAWAVIVLLGIQIALYPPTMHDSLSYRLPRMFLALQNGSLGGFVTPDPRMNGMPWGWEMLALPFASLNLSNSSKWINLACWAITYQLLFATALSARIRIPRARFMAIAFAAAPGFLLQASSTANDLYAATMLLAAAWMVRRFHQAPGPLPVMASLLALILAANAKPQFLTFGAAWLLWWVFAPGQPWRSVRVAHLALAAPVFLAISPLPLLAINYHTTGSLMGETGLLFGEKPAAWMMATAGIIQFLGSQLQLPLFPGAESFSSLLQSLPGFQELSRSVPKFAPAVTVIPIVDSASIGFLHFAMIASGLAIVLRHRFRSEVWWVAAAAAAFLLSASQVVPGTIGRSFMGFITPLLPGALIGLSLFRGQRLIAMACFVAFAGGLVALVTNPSSPLWPSQAAKRFAENRSAAGLVSLLEKYHAYQTRATTGLALLSPVPRGESVGLLIRQVTPISPLWLPDWRSHRLEFVHDTKPEDFLDHSINWLVVAENSAEQFPEIYEAYRSLPGWSVVAERTYLPNISQGNELWKLHRRDVIANP